MTGKGSEKTKPNANSAGATAAAVVVGNRVRLLFALFLLVLTVSGGAAAPQLSVRLIDETDKRSLPHFNIQAFTRDRRRFSNCLNCIGRQNRQRIDFRLTEGDCYLVPTPDSWTCSTSRPDGRPLKPVIIITQNAQNAFEAKLQYYYWRTPPARVTPTEYDEENQGVIFNNQADSAGELRIYGGHPDVKMTRRRMSRKAIEFSSRINSVVLAISMVRNGVMCGLVNKNVGNRKATSKIPYSYGWWDAGKKVFTGGEKRDELTLKVAATPVYPLQRFYFGVDSSHDDGDKFYLRDAPVQPGEPTPQRPVGLGIMVVPHALRVNFVRMDRQSWPHPHVNLIGFVTYDEQAGDVMVHEQKDKITVTKINREASPTTLTGTFIVQP